MRTGVIYARYSSERQTEQSIEGQIRECMSYAERHDIVIVDTYIDRAMTGTNDKRDEFQRMLKDSQKRPWDVVLVYKLDRFSRNKYEMAIHKRTLKDNNIALLSAAENIPEGPEGIILESLLEGMAEYYSAELSQKVRRGLKETRIKGNFTGGTVPFGYEVINKKVVIKDDEAQVVRRIYNMYLAGVYGKQILKTLADEGITNRGKPFTINTIYYLLRNERYVGMYHHKTEGAYTDMYPRILPQDVFDKVQAILNDNKHGKHPKDAGYMLKGKIKCGLCGKVMSGDAGTSKTGRVVRYYSCMTRKQSKKCNKKAVRKDIIEKLIVDVTVKILSDPKNIDLLVERLFQAHEEKLADRSVENLLLKEREKLQTALDNVLRAVEQGLVTNSTKKRLEELEESIEIIDSKILIERSKTKSAITPADIRKFIGKVLKKEPMPMIRSLVKEAKLFEDRIEVYYNYIDKKGPDALEHQVFSLYSEDFEIVPTEIGLAHNIHNIVIKMEMFF